MAPRQAVARLNNQDNVVTRTIGSTKADTLLAFRKKVAPLISHIGHAPAGPDDATTIGLVTRTYSDGTWHQIALEKLAPTEAGEDGLTCLTEIRGPKSLFPRLSAGSTSSRKRRATIEAAEDNPSSGSDEGETGSAQRREPSAGPSRPRLSSGKKQAKANGRDSKETRKVTARAERAAKRARRATAPTPEVEPPKPSTSALVLPTHHEVEDENGVGELSRMVGEMDVISNCPTSRQSDASESTQVVTCAQPPKN